MTTAEVQSLLNENTCLSCYGLSLSDLIKIGLLSDISSSTGGGGGTPSLPLNSVQFNDGGVFGGDADFTWNKTTNLLAITGGIALTAETNENPFAVTGYSLTGANAQSLLSLAGTWNTSGNPVGIRLAITNTTSGATSKLLELLAGAAGATSMFSVDKSGIGVLASDLICGTGTGEIKLVTASAAISIGSILSIQRNGGTGELTFTTNAESVTFNPANSIVRFNGSTSAFPALKRNATTLQARLADDSAFCTIQGILKTEVNATAAAPPVTTHTIPITDASGTVYRCPCLV